MDQISFFSAEASGPELADLAGVLCGPARIVSFGRTAARLSVPVAESWRVRVLATEFARRGVRADAVTEEGRQLVRTAFRADLIGLANTWCPDGVKMLPPGFRLTGGALRLWALAAGSPAERGYQFAVDDQAEIHAALVVAFQRLGLPVRVGRSPEGDPVVRVTGRRAVATLGELLGTPPPAAEPVWPAGITARRPVPAVRERKRRAGARAVPGPMHATIW
ncbi:hypothetical protein [Amycolatopsis pigmentata]|uniref:Uncharacterized protein n=1 Tax=Amycolatopsis pigmentata TaxID=450801 RepID=A0ABW5FRC3_9PSEU